MYAEHMRVPFEEVLKLKAILGISYSGLDTEPADDEETRLLAVLLGDARDFILAYTGRNYDRWLPVFDGAAREIAVIAYNMRGDEGASSKKEGALSVSYIGRGDLPKRVLRVLNRYRVI